MHRLHSFQSSHTSSMSQSWDLPVPSALHTCSEHAMHESPSDRICNLLAASAQNHFLPSGHWIVHRTKCSKVTIADGTAVASHHLLPPSVRSLRSPLGQSMNFHCKAHRPPLSSPMSRSPEAHSGHRLSTMALKHLLQHTPSSSVTERLCSTAAA